MSAALDELNTRIAELKADLVFVTLAAQLRPRIGDVVEWKAGGEVLELVKQFMNAKSVRPEGVFGPLLVRLLAVFQRYLRLLVSYTVEQRTSALKVFDEVPPGLGNRNLLLTGRILASVDAPRDYLPLDTDALIANLASCKRGSTSFRLNALAFSAAVTGASPDVVEKALENVDVSGWWDSVGGDDALAKLLATKGARATATRTREKLRELWRWRNHLAHGGDDVALSEGQLLEAIEFIKLFSNALDSTVNKVVKKMK